MIKREPRSQLDWALSRTGCTTMMLMMRVIIWRVSWKDGGGVREAGRASEDEWKHEAIPLEKMFVVLSTSIPPAAIVGKRRCGERG